MEILLVDDGDYKKDRVENFLNSEFEYSTITTCGSYSSAVKIILSKKFDLAIIDMSLPTFDNNNGQNGGDFRAYGGLDIARQIKRKKVNLKFVFLTQYSTFSDNPTIEKFSDIDSIAGKECNDLYLGCIFYDHSGFEWKEQLKRIISSYA